MKIKDIYDETKWTTKNRLMKTYNSMHNDEKTRINIDGHIYRIESFIDHSIIKIKCLKEYKECDEVKDFIRNGLIEAYNTQNDEEKFEINIDGYIYRLESFVNNSIIQIKYLRKDKYRIIKKALIPVLLVLIYFCGYFMGKAQ